MSPKTDFRISGANVIFYTSQIHFTVPASDTGNLIAALHPDTRMGDTGVRCVHRLPEHALLDPGLPGVDAPRAASKAGLGPPDWSIILDAYFRLRLVVLVVLVRSSSALFFTFLSSIFIPLYVYYSFISFDLFCPKRHKLFKQCAGFLSFPPRTLFMYVS